MATAATLLAAGNRAAIVPAAGVASVGVLQAKATRRASLAPAVGVAVASILQPPSTLSTTPGRRGDTTNLSTGARPANLSRGRRPANLVEI
jgi:hypothetical protein